MLRASPKYRFASYKLPARNAINNIDSTPQVAITVPPPAVGEVGGKYGTSTQYSSQMSNESFEKRMSRSTFQTRMEENQTLYPMSAHRQGEFDIRYLPRAFPDPLKNRSLLEIGQPDDIPEMMVPVIFLSNVKHSPLTAAENAASSSSSGASDESGGNESTTTNVTSELAGPNSDAVAAGAKISGELTDGPFTARKHETHYVTQTLMRRKLQPQRLAVYATPENYRLLGLPVRDLKINAEIPKNREEYQKIRAKQLWDNERWRFSFEMLFRKYDRGPPELLDDQLEMWDGMEELAPSSGLGKDGAGAGAGKKGPIVNRKAKKIKLF